MLKLDERVLSAVTAIALVVFLLSRAIGFAWSDKGSIAIISMTIGGVIVWLCFLLWFARRVPVTATLAFVTYVMSRLLGLSRFGEYWVDSRSFYVHDGTWVLAEILVGIAFVLLAYALWRTHYFPIPVVAIFLIYIGVTIVRALGVDQLDIGTYATMTFVRNLSGGVCYCYLTAYFFIESRTPKH